MPCNGPKQACSTRVHDASADQVIMAARAVATALRQRGARGVAVRHASRLGGNIVRQAGMAQCGWTYMSIEDMVLTLEASLRVNVARFGNVTLRQRGGAPYWGPPQRLGSRTPPWSP